MMQPPLIYCFPVAFVDLPLNLAGSQWIVWSSMHESFLRGSDYFLSSYRIIRRLARVRFVKRLAGFLLKLSFASLTPFLLLLHTVLSWQPILYRFSTHRFEHGLGRISFLPSLGNSSYSLSRNPIYKFTKFLYIARWGWSILWHELFSHKVKMRLGPQAISSLYISLAARS